MQEQEQGAGSAPTLGKDRKGKEQAREQEEHGAPTSARTTTLRTRGGGEQAREQVVHCSSIKDRQGWK